MFEKENDWREEFDNEFPLLCDILHPYIYKPEHIKSFIQTLIDKAREEGIKLHRSQSAYELAKAEERDRIVGMIEDAMPSHDAVWKVILSLNNK